MHRASAALAAVLLPALLAGCGSDDSGAGSDDAKESPAPPADLPRSDEPHPLDPASMTTDVTNPWFPLEPGTRWTYREVDEEGTAQRVVVTVTSETRRIADGTEALVVRDTVTEDGEVTEDTFDWYAQDADGTVWYLGEDTAEYGDGPPDTEGSWETGVDGALAGVIMPAEPAPGQSYRQEYLKGVAEDNGEVLATGRSATVPAGAYDDLLLTADTSGLEPKVLEKKYYARSVGLVLTIEDGAREELVGTEHVSPAEARRAGTVALGEPY